MMEKVQLQENRIRRNWVNWLLAAALTAVCFCLTYLTKKVLFATNDDTRILYALAGYNTGTPFPYQDFINVSIGWIVAGLYSLVPAVPWYAVCHMMYLAVGTLILFQCVFSVGSRHRVPTWICAWINVAYFIAAILYSAVSMQFSTSAAVIGMSGVALLFSIDEKNDSRGTIRLKVAFSALLICACYALRSYSAYCAICFYALTLLYHFVSLLNRRPAKDRKKMVLPLVAAVLIVAAAIPIMRFGSQYVRKQMTSEKVSEEYNAARVRVQDYRMFPAYKGNEAFYESIGWNKYTYSALLGVQFMDEAMTADAFEAMTKEYLRQKAQEGTPDIFGGNIGNLFKKLKSVYKNYTIARGITVFSAILLLSGVFLWIMGRKKWLEGCYLVFSFLGGMLLIVLFAYRGRLPLRMFLAVMQLTCAMQIMGVLKFAGEKKDEDESAESGENRKGRRIIRGIVFSMILVSVLLTMGYCLRSVYILDECARTDTQTTASLEDFQAFERYAIAHQNNVYVYDFTVATVARDPFVVYPNDKPINCLVSGGSYIHSTPYYQQLEKLGLEELTWDTLLQDNVCYATNSVDYCMRICNILELRTGQKMQYEMIESFGNDGIMVFRFGPVS